MTNSSESWTLVSNFLCYINRPLIKAILNWKHLNKISGLIAEETAVPSNAYYFAVIFSLATRLKKICRSNMVTIARWLKEKYVSKHCLCMFLISLHWPVVSQQPLSASHHLRRCFTATQWTTACKCSLSEKTRNTSFVLPPSWLRNTAHLASQMQIMSCFGSRYFTVKLSSQEAILSVSKRSKLDVIWIVVLCAIWWWWCASAARASLIIKYS